MIEYRPEDVVDRAAERAKQVAAVQNKFWDVHGPNADLFAEGKITQPEFSERSHKAMIEFATDMEKIFTDDEYQKVFDVPKGTDTFYVLAHSKEEQPHPTEASETNDPPPPPTSDKFPKGGVPAPPPAGK